MHESTRRRFEDSSRRCSPERRVRRPTTADSSHRWRAASFSLPRHRRISLRQRQARKHSRSRDFPAISHCPTSSRAPADAACRRCCSRLRLVRAGSTRILGLGLGFRRILGASAALGRATTPFSFARRRRLPAKDRGLDRRRARAHARRRVAA